MPLQLNNLDSLTRAMMMMEIESDAQNQTLYLSTRLSAAGITDYLALLREAAEKYDDTWLASQLQLNSRINLTEVRKKPTGGTTVVNVPITAAATLAEGEFNRFYIRGLCLRAIDSGINDLQIYRAKEVSNPRPESVAKIGTNVSAQALLTDLREAIGVDTAFGLPSGPNSGLSVRIP